MKIKYDSTDKYYKYYDEANGVFLLRKKLKKNPNVKIRGFISHFTLLIVLSIIEFLIYLIISPYIKLEIKFIIYILIFIIAICCFEIILFFYSAKFNSKAGVLEINKEGILDKSKSGIQFGLSYNNIELIVITDDLITFVAEYPIIIYINYSKNNLDKIINEIKKYSDVQIIMKTDS